MPKLKKQMTPLLAVLFLCNLCDAETLYKPKCSNSTGNIASMKPSEDGVSGRYTITWCTDLDKNDTKWIYELGYNRRNLKNCSNRNKHSSETIHLNNFDLNCTHVCLSTDVDLIFSACYSLQNLLPSRGSMRDVSTHNISNSYTIGTFSNASYTGTTVNHENYVSAHFYLGTIPATDFNMELCKKQNDTHNDVWDCMDVRENCSAVVTEVRCRVHAAPGRYDLRMAHRAAWVGADFALTKELTHLPFDVAEGRGSGAEAGGGGGGRALVGAGAGLGALLVLAVLAVLALRRGRALGLKHRVLGDWINRQESKATKEDSGEGVRPIILLYAREGPAAEPCLEVLKELLETVAPGQVWDLHSAAAVAAWAPAPARWLRHMMGARRARLLLLQTPALALAAPAPPAEQPLLGTRGVYRVPAAADMMLPLVLRLTDLAPAPYTQYYLATLEGMETEAVPYAVPFRRYVLPRHTPALLHHLCGGVPDPPPAPHLVDRLARAVLDFVDHARAHPHYLMDELVLLPPGKAGRVPVKIPLDNYNEQLVLK